MRDVVRSTPRNSLATARQQAETRHADRSDGELRAAVSLAIKLAATKYHETVDPRELLAALRASFLRWIPLSFA
jgi:hypothetical protein